MKLSKKYRWFLNNLISFTVLNILGLYFRKNKNYNNSLLLFNGSVLGDVLISSILIEYENSFENYSQVYFIFPHEYVDLFYHYKGNVCLIPYNKKKYKWSIIYRINILSKLRSLRTKDCINLTSSRGISCDEIALLSCSKNIYCLHNTWEKNPKLFSKIIDSKYDQILFPDGSNEYQRHQKIVETFGVPQRNTLPKNIFRISERPVVDNVERKEQVIIAPLAGDINRAWNLSNYVKLAVELSKFFEVYFLGSKYEQKQIERILPKCNRIHNQAGAINLADIYHLISESKLFIGNDSGLTHLALRTTTPLIAIIGGGTFGKYLPYQESNSKVYLYSKMNCFGCDWFCHQQERYCLTNVSYSEVIKTVRLLLHHENT